MSDPFISEIRLFSFTYPPKGWALCNGQLLPINQNQALFSLLGTTYGGDGRVSFALPDLRDRVPVHVGNGVTLGERGGEAAHTLAAAELPQHTHVLTGTSAAAVSANPSPSVVLAGSVGASAYAPPSSPVAMSPAALSTVGGSQAHENMPPFLTISFCIALVGIFPSQN
jgi:microcystin-dependent protein